MWRREEGWQGAEEGGGEVARAVGRLRGRVGWGVEGGRRPIQGRGHGEAGPRHKLHQYKSNGPRGLEGLIYE